MLMASIVMFEPMRPEEFDRHIGTSQHFKLVKLHCYVDDTFRIEN